MVDKWEPIMGRQHPSFPQPTDPNETAWRYMDLARYLALLSSKQLYLAGVSTLGDPFEGSIPRNSRKAWREQIISSLDPNSRDGMEASLIAADQASGNFGERAKRATYVSCWCLGRHESEAMWQIFCGQNQGVAVALPYSRLAESITHPYCYIGRVQYLDYDNDVLAINNVFNPFMAKRIAFAHEREVRILVSHWSKVAIGLPADLDLPHGISISWDIEMHADRIVVSPYAREWFHDVVRDATKALAPTLAQKLVPSAMAGTPVY